MFGHASWMQRMNKGCYIDTGDKSTGAGDDSAGADDTRDAGVDDSLDDDPEDGEGEDDTEPEAKPDADKGDPDVDAAQDKKEPTKPKQSPEFDAVAARLRKTEEKAAQLEAALQAKNAQEESEKAQKVQQDEKARLEQEWNVVLNRAQKMKTDGYDDLIISEYVDRQRDRIENRLKIQELEQKLTQTQQQNAQTAAQQQKAQAVKYFFEEIGELRKSYGDLVPDASGVKSNLEGFLQYTKKLPPEMMDRIARGYSPTDAFRAVNYDKLASHEKKLEQKRTLANVSDRLKRGGIASDSEGAASGSDVVVNREMAEAFGNNPKDIAKYVKQQTKPRR